MDIMTIKNNSYMSKYGKMMESVQNYWAKEYGDNKTWGAVSDTQALGKYLESVEEFLPHMLNESAGSTNAANLGNMLSQSLGLAATQYATSIIPFIGSTQPTDNQIAIIYYKTAIASSERNGVGIGDVVMNEFGRISSSLDDYTSSDQLKTFAMDSYSSNSITINNITSSLGGEVRPGSLRITIVGSGSTGSIQVIDSGNEVNGKGALYGNQIDSDASYIEYSTGKLVVKTTSGSVTVDTSCKMEVTFNEVITGADHIPGWKYKLVSESIPVNYWPIQTSYDLVADFIAKKQFGTSLGQLASQDLLNQINRIVSYNAIKQLRIAALKNEGRILAGSSPLGTISWSVKAPTGVSEADHRRTFFDIYEEATRRMEVLTGIGGVSAIITGSEGRKIYRNMGLDSQASKPGAHIIGFLDGIPVIYAPNDLLPADDILIVHKGDDLFTTPLVYSPFLPVMTAEVSGRNGNVFQKQQGIVHGAGMKAVNQGLVQRIHLSDTGLKGADLSLSKLPSRG